MRLGSSIKISKRNNLYKAFIGCAGNGTLSNPGKIYFVNKGTDDEGVVYNWEIAKDKRYRGTFTVDRPYFLDEYVYYNGYFYKALTNIAGDGTTFIATEWQLVTNDSIRSIDYLGYVPNNTEILPIFDSADPSTVLDQDGLYNFDSIRISQNGEVLIAKIRYKGQSASGPNRRGVVVYRNYNGNYQRHQTILADQFDQSLSADGLNAQLANVFAADIDISKDGTMLAISELAAEVKRTDEDPTLVTKDQGRVFLLKQSASTGFFEYSQTLYSRNNEPVEFFGTSLSFDNTTLAICAKNADSKSNTTFDTNALNVPQTTYDNNFTLFTKKYIDTGVVYLYESVNGTLVYGQTLTYINDDSSLSAANTNALNSVKDFGINLYANNNHVYVGLPTETVLDGTNGAVIDFRKVDGTSIWKTHASPKNTVDVAKIKKLQLYDTKENKLVKYLDYLDPIQGKIAGIAEQELSYKLYYDPAVYTNGNTEVNVGLSDIWGAEQVGQLWWDLSTAKFLNPYQSNIIFSTNNWNKQFPSGNSIDVYEWVESNLLPSEWNAIAETEEGVTEDITGITKYDDTVYSIVNVFDSIAQKFSAKYHYWVKGKITAPNIEGRTISSFNVARYIDDPAGMGYKFVNFLTPNSFVIHNCRSLIKDKDVAISVQYWTIENQEINIHNQYQLFTAGLESSKPNIDIERKWFDSSSRL